MRQEVDNGANVRVVAGAIGEAESVGTVTGGVVGALTGMVGFVTTGFVAGDSIIGAAIGGVTVGMPIGADGSAIGEAAGVVNVGATIGAVMGEPTGAVGVVTTGKSIGASAVGTFTGVMRLAGVKVVVATGACVTNASGTGAVDAGISVTGGAVAPSTGTGI